MVNKCSVICCKTLYSNEQVILHRFPILKPEKLPIWIAFTGRKNNWKPGNSSRICGNHFIESDYVIGHMKHVLKTTAIPTIEYHDMSKKRGKKSDKNVDQMNLPLNVEPEESSDTDFEIAEVNYDNLNNLNIVHQNKEDIQYDNEESYDGIEDQEYTDIIYGNVNKHLNFSSLENSYDNEDESNHDDTVQNENEDFDNEIKTDVCNRKNQCYAFTSSFEKNFNYEPPCPEDELPCPLENSLNVITDQTTADLNFKKMMALKLIKQQHAKRIQSFYSKSYRRFRKQEKYKNSFNNDDTDLFAKFIRAQMNDLYPHKKVYLSAKHKIKKILMEAQNKLANQI